MAQHIDFELTKLLKREDILKDAKDIITNSISKVGQVIQKLQEDEVKYRSLFNESPIAQIEFDLSDIISYLNQLKIRNLPDFVRFLENNPEEILKLGRKLKLVRMNETSLQLFQIDTKEKWTLEKIGSPHKGHPHFKTILNRVLYSDKERSFYLYSDKNEMYLHTIPKKEEIYVISKFSFLPPQQLFGSFIDVTPLKEAEDRIRESEQGFRRLFEDAPFPLMEFDFSELKNELNNLKGKEITNLEEYLNSNPEIILNLSNMVILKHANSAALKLFEVEEISQWSFYKVGGTRFPFFIEFLESILKGHTDKEFRGIGQNAKGKDVHVLIKLLVVPGYEETFSKVLTSIIDITKLKEAEGRIRFSEEKLRNIIVHSKDGIILVDETGRMIFH